VHRRDNCGVQLPWGAGRYTRVRHRADRGAMRLIVEPLAFGAFVGVNQIREAPDADRRIRTFQLASATAGAPRGNDLVRHDLISNVRILRPVHAIERAQIACTAFALVVKFGIFGVFISFYILCILSTIANVFGHPQSPRELPGKRRNAAEMPSDCSQCLLCRQDVMRVEALITQHSGGER
jgi:hypothetical protein